MAYRTMASALGLALGMGMGFAGCQEPAVGFGGGTGTTTGSNLDPTTSTAEDHSGSGLGGGDTTGGTTTGTVPPDPTLGSEEGPESSDEGFDFDVDGGGEVVCIDDCVDINGPGEAGAWLLHFGNGANLMSARMAQIDVATGETIDLCDLEGPNLVQGAFKSATFTRNNRLIASDGRNLYEVDQCACTYTWLGQFPMETTQIYGIAPDEGSGLFGVSANSGSLLRINPNNAHVTVVGGLGLENVGAHGLTWSESQGRLYFVEATTDGLYDVDLDTGEATLIATLSNPVDQVGVEMHPSTDELYVCGMADDKLHLVDAETGVTTALADGPPNCKNLGAPWATGGMVCVPEG